LKTQRLNASYFYYIKKIKMLGCSSWCSTKKLALILEAIFDLLLTLTWDLRFK
jgi:hypothetical protein